MILLMIWDDFVICRSRVDESQADLESEGGEDGAAEGSYNLHFSCLNFIVCRKLRPTNFK